MYVFHHVLDTILLILGCLGCLGTVWYLFRAPAACPGPEPERERDWQRQAYWSEEDGRWYVPGESTWIELRDGQLWVTSEDSERVTDME